MTSVGRPLWAGAASASPSARVAGLPAVPASAAPTAPFTRLRKRDARCDADLKATVMQAAGQTPANRPT